MHQIILDAHPGSIDDLNPAFRVWAEAGYREALALIPRVETYDGALSAVRYYTSGFLDGHIFYSDNVRSDESIGMNGWRIDAVGGAYVVTGVAAHWPSELPPMGARLVECDGLAPDEVLQSFVAPFVDRRNTPAINGYLAPFLSLDFYVGKKVSRCRFQTPTSASVDIAVVYQSVPFQAFMSLNANAPHPRRRSNSFTLKNGVLWITATNFNLAARDVTALEVMLNQLAKLKGVKWIVFDSRGNGGGDSSVGDQIFDAATGGLEYDRKGIEQLPRLYAQWRVSDVSIANARSYVTRVTELYGAASPRVPDAQAQLEKLLAAKAAGDPWVDQDDGYLVTREDVRRRHGHLRRFRGRIALITDSRCASACLDFADLIRLVPSSVHLGSTTSADTLYIDVGRVFLPSGNAFKLPLKVWRNRLRGNNEPWVPDVRLDCGLDDDVAVRRATLAVLARLR